MGAERREEVSPSTHKGIEVKGGRREWVTDEGRREESWGEGAGCISTQVKIPVE